MKTLIKNGIVLINGKRRIDNGAVLTEGHKIIGLYKDYSDIDCDQEIDANGQYIIPGLIETHTHGILGYDFNTCQMDDLHKVSDALLQEGVTSFLASLTCESLDDTLKLLEKYQGTNIDNLKGVHLEGPFLSKDYKGVMKPECLRVPDLDTFKDFLKICPKLKSMTIAPELSGALSIITYGHNQDVVMNIGHSNATASQVIEAQHYGAKGITHLYNAMSQHVHREPGVVTGAINSNLYCELIVDGFHIHEDVIKATYKAIGKDRIILICDANPCKGLPDGTYEFSGKDVEIIDGRARVKETGRIAGSTLALNVACRNIMRITGCCIDDAITMASVNPAKLYSLNKGKIEVGYDADVLVVNENFDIYHIMNQGKIIK